MTAGPVRARLGIALALTALFLGPACHQGLHLPPSGGPSPLAPAQQRGPMVPPRTFAGGPLPNVFFIVLDDHGGPRSITDLLGYDLQPFLGALRQRGFYVPDHPTANYPRSALSLASMLNLDYVQALLPTPGDQSSEEPAEGLIEQAKVPDIFQANGYRYVHLGSWWKPTRTDARADVELRMPGQASAAQALGVELPAPTGDLPLGIFLYRRQEYPGALWQFDQLAKLRDAPQPTFVFAHILAPHRPYVFDQHGRLAGRPAPTPEALGRAYVDEVRFVDQKFLKLVDALLSGPSDRRPVIILQSDEGFYEASTGGSQPSDKEVEQHFDTVAAYELPGLSSTALYPTMTPVNLFRVLFDDYFGAGLPLLPDRNYIFPGTRHLYTFVDVTQQVRRLS